MSEFTQGRSQLHWHDACLKQFGGVSVQLGLVIVGVDHCTAPAQFVDRLRDCADLFPDAVAKLRGSQNIAEIAYVALPYRTEILLASWNPVKAANDVLDMLTTLVRLRMEDWTAFHRYMDEAAIVHLLAIAGQPGGEAIWVQLESSWEQSHKSGAAGRLLSRLTQAIREHSHAAQDSIGRENIRTTARHVWSKLQADAALPGWLKFRNEVDAICAEEIATFRRSCGGLMTDDQERAVKIVTARISERVGEWITRAWNDPATRVQPRIRENP